MLIFLRHFTFILFEFHSVTSVTHPALSAQVFNRWQEVSGHTILERFTCYNF